MDMFLARDGKDAWKDFDGVFFLYAGDRVQTHRGSLYWPHRRQRQPQGQALAVLHRARRAAADGDISVFCHEFGHMLGLPDLYARPENPGMEGRRRLVPHVQAGRPGRQAAALLRLVQGDSSAGSSPTVIDPPSSRS